MNKRLKFFFTHLVVSALIALLSIIIVFWIWYPAPLAQAVGVTKIFLMMLMIDVIIGPLFTLLVYKEGKKTLKFDLSVIILIQMTAFLFGFYSIAQGRPAWIVFNQNKFELIRINERYIEHPEYIAKEFKTPSWIEIKNVAVQPSSNTKQRSDELFAEALGGISLAQRPERYVALDQQREQMKASAMPLSRLKRFNSSQQVEEIMTQYPHASAWLPLKANNLDMVVLINKDTASVVKIVNLRPWQE